MSVIVKIIKSEERNAKAKTKALVENREAIKAEAAEIAIIRQSYWGKDFAAAMIAQGFGALADRKNRNNLDATVWLATEEGAAAFDAWCADDERPLCETLRGIKKAATPKATRAAQTPEGGDSEEAEAVEASADKAPRTAADILKNAFDQCRAAGISPEEFLEFVISAEGAKVADKAIDKAAA
jgi:hypothetical protein|tara:strand:+ start:135 stop:683 length:549 start_codon:yes stop_codon:yes gene_type:complete